VRGWELNARSGLPLHLKVLMIVPRDDVYLERHKPRTNFPLGDDGHFVTFTLHTRFRAGMQLLCPSGRHKDVPELAVDAFWILQTCVPPRFLRTCLGHAARIGRPS